MESNKNLVLMTYRKINYLAESEELIGIIDKYNLRCIIDSRRLFLLSDCIIIEIHGLVPETIFYFDVYSIDLELYSSLDRLLSDCNTEKIHCTYQAQITNRKQVLISELQGNEKNTLEAEQYFFTMLQLLDEQLSEIMLCQKKIDEKHWSKIFDYKKRELQLLFNSGNSQS